MSRVEDRRDFELPVRTTLLEGDADNCDDERTTIRDELKKFREQQHEENRNRSNQMTQLLGGLAVALVLVAVDIFLRAAG